MKMDKKAVTQVDWAVSMGIFLIYVLSMFVMIQPGIQPINKKETMGGIAEKQLQLDIYYNITRIPLFITMNNPMSSNDKTFQIKNLPLGEITRVDLNITYIDRTSLLETQAQYRIRGESQGNIKIMIPYTPPAVPTTYNFFAYYGPGKYREVDFTGANTPYNEQNMDVHFGAPEMLEGIDPAALAAIKCANKAEYDILKDKWGFPTGKDFAIYYVPSAKLPYDLNSKVDVCNIAAPYDQSNVYVKEWSDWILKPDGTRIPVIFNLRVW